jgi:hypothetical protein
LADGTFQTLPAHHGAPVREGDQNLGAFWRTSQGQVFVPRFAAREGCTVSNQILHAFPGAGRENSGVFARVRLPFVPDRARVQDVGQYSPQRVQRHGPPFARRPTDWAELMAVLPE